MDLQLFFGNVFPNWEDQFMRFAFQCEQAIKLGKCPLFVKIRRTQYYDSIIRDEVKPPLMLSKMLWPILSSVRSNHTLLC